MSEPAAAAPPGERMMKLAESVLPKIEAAIRQCFEEDGAWTRQRGETLQTLERLLEKFHGYTRIPEEKQKLARITEDEIAGILDAIDRRIVELAEGYAGRLVAAQPGRPADKGAGGGAR